jgi:cytochrome P450
MFLTSRKASEPYTLGDSMYTPEFFANPHPEYARLREEAPVRQVRNPNGLEYWLVTRYAEARALFADDRLAKDPRLAWDALRSAGFVRGEQREATFDLHTTDPPDHTRLRRLVGKGFTQARVDALVPRIEEIAEGLLGAREFDLIEDYAYPLSLTVITELLGVPVADRDQFRAWTMAAMTPPFVTDRALSREEGARLLRQYVTELVADKRSRPADGSLLSALIAARDEDEGLTEAELVALTQQMLFAGHEPTMNLIGNGMVSLFANPAQLALLRADPALLPGAIEELLRYDGPTARSSPHYTLVDVEVGDVVIPAGSVVIIGIASANRDPRRFPDPDRLDVTRAGSHLAFGHGIHRCVGAALARVEGRVAIGTLVRRFPSLRPTVPLAELTWLPFPVFRGVAALPVSAG